MAPPSTAPFARMSALSSYYLSNTRRKIMTATAAQPKGRPWWLTLIMGIAAVAIGGILIVRIAHRPGPPLFAAGSIGGHLVVDRWHHHHHLHVRRSHGAGAGSCFRGWSACSPAAGFCSIQFMRRSLCRASSCSSSVSGELFHGAQLLFVSLRARPGDRSCWAQSWWCSG